LLSGAGRHRLFMLSRFMLSRFMLSRARWAPYAASVANFERSKTFRELVAVVEAEFAAREMSLKPGAAADIVRDRVQQVATQMRITPTSALRYFTADAAAEIARNTTRMLKEHQASQDARPPVRLTAAQAGLVISAFTVAARLGVVNGDPDVAADLCEVITGVSMGLRDGGPVEVSALLLSNGLAWAGLPAEKLAGGGWSVLPGKSRPEDDAGVAAQLRRDLDAIMELHRTSA